MMNVSQVIIKPVLTEKSVNAATRNKYTFEINREASKVDVKMAVRSLYGVNVVQVNILKGLPKWKNGKGRNLVQKRSETRKAIVTLKDGDKLELTHVVSEKAAKKTSNTKDKE